jgi:2-phosphosulfolactate phosphatase
MSLVVLYTPGHIAQFASCPDPEAVCVVIDVLRATSTIITALARGARSVRPVLEVEEALRIKQAHPGTVLGGERGGLSPEGFDLGNSPEDYIPEKIKGRDLILTTTNGTRALLACQGAAETWAAGFLNLQAVARALRASPRPAVLVCAGTGNGFSLEDAWVAGALAGQIAPSHPAAILARAYPESAFYHTQNARRLAGLGLRKDVAWCRRENMFNAVPKLAGDGTLRLY